jgi:hypothetical protein
MMTEIEDKLNDARARLSAVEATILRIERLLENQPPAYLNQREINDWKRDLRRERNVAATQQFELQFEVIDLETKVRKERNDRPSSAPPLPLAALALFGPGPGARSMRSAQAPANERGKPAKSPAPPATPCRRFPRGDGNLASDPLLDEEAGPGGAAAPGARGAGKSRASQPRVARGRPGGLSLPDARLLRAL